MLQSTVGNSLSLRRTITMAIIIASFVPLVMVLWVIHVHLGAAFASLTHENLQSLADRHSTRIDTFVEERCNSVALLRETLGERLFEPHMLRKALADLQAIYGESIVDMGLVNAAGRQVFYAGPLQLERANYATAPWFQQVRQAKNPKYVSDVFLGLRKSPHFIMAFPLTHQGEQWILRATVDFAHFSRIVREIRVGDTGTACIINTKGEYQTLPLERHTPDTSLSQAAHGLSGPPTPSASSSLVSSPTFSSSSPSSSPSSLPSSLPASPLPLNKPETTADTTAHGQELADKVQSLFGHNWRKDPAYRIQSDDTYLYAISLLQGRQWALVVRVSQAEAFAKVTETERALDIVLALVSLAVLCGGVLLSWRVMNRIDALEKERAALNEHLVEAGKLSALGEMAAGIAHEINNPVAIMMEEAGWIDDLLMDMPKDGSTEEVTASVAKIRTQGARCRAITHKLLGFARKSDDPEQSVDIGSLLREMVALANEKARTAGVSISVDIAPDLEPVIATTSVLQQIFLNIFNNAVDAMENTGGSLHIHATAGEEAHSIRVAVTDTGPGIPPKVLKRIFDPFFTTKPAGKGTGLGLSICFSIVQGLGGHIRVDSVEGQGTTFHITLPTVRG